MIPYLYGIPPAYWSKERAAAGEAARDVIALSTRVGDTLRNACGKKEDVLDLRPEIRRLFTGDAERAEAHRLLDLVAWMRRNRRADVANKVPLWEEVGK